MKIMDNPEDELFLRVLRPLVECYDLIVKCDEEHIKKLGFTQMQFDVIITLGETKGLTRDEIATEILFHRSDMAEALDDLELKELIEYVGSEEGEKGQQARLTRLGRIVFDVFMPNTFIT